MASLGDLGTILGDLGDSGVPLGATLEPSWALLDGLGRVSKLAEEDVDVKMTTLEGLNVGNAGNTFLRWFWLLCDRCEEGVDAKMTTLEG